MKCACGCSSTEEREEVGTNKETRTSTRRQTLAAEAAGVQSMSVPKTAVSQAVGTVGNAGHINAEAGDLPGHESETSGCSCGKSCGEEEQGMKRYEKVALICAGVLLGIALIFEHLLGWEIPMIVAASASIIAGLVIVLPETYESLKAKSIDINVLLIVAIIGAIYVGALEEAAAVLFLFSVGEYLEGRAMRKSTDAIKDLAKLAPDTAYVMREGTHVEIPTDKVMLGETVLIRPGTAAPLDGVITKGSSSFNDAAITGESIPVFKTIGDKVFAASLSVDGSCEIETTSTVENSTLAKISELVQQAQKKKSERENFVRRFAKVYTPIVIVVAFFVAFVPPLVTMSGMFDLGDFNTWIYRACELLVISCPCAFVISTPVTIVSALTRAAKLGILVKGGVFFEEGSRVQAIAFDKTGTLTKGKPEVVHVIQAKSNEYSEQTLAHIAAQLEYHSTHPLAHAITQHALRFDAAQTAEVEEVTELAGKGVSGVIDGVSYAIGSEQYITQTTGLPAEILQGMHESDMPIGTLIYLARTGSDPKLLATFVVADTLREESRSTMSRLKQTKQKLFTVMLTGDNEVTAHAIAEQVGVDEVHASLLPQDKTTELEQLTDRFDTVAFVGDGINDAPSIATANVGIAMGGAGSDAALSSADVVLMADDVSMLPKFFELSRKTVAILQQNVVLAIGLKVLVAFLVVIGVAQMWMAVLADTGVSLLVIANGMRLMRTRLK